MTTTDHSVHWHEQLLFAERLITEGKYAAAVEALRTLTRQAPTFGRAYSQLAWIYGFKFQKYKESEELYKRALDYDPEYLPTYYQYAALLSMQRQFDALNSLIEQALTLEGINKGIILNEKAIMHELQGEYSQAIETYQESIRHLLEPREIDSCVSALQRCQRKMTIFGGTRVSD